MEEAGPWRQMASVGRRGQVTDGRCGGSKLLVAGLEGAGVVSVLGQVSKKQVLEAVIDGDRCRKMGQSWQM